jgi:3-oxoacyl-[acyl-carrier protein] reductase
MTSKLNGKVALITGSSRGIGRAIAMLFVQEGAKVAINYNKSETQARELSNLIRKMGGEALLVKADVSNSKEVKQMVIETVRAFGGIDILVNNAGIIFRKDFFDSSEEELDQILDINLKGTYLCCQEVAQLMLERKKGKIINMASISGLAAEPSGLRYPNYAASKAGVIGLTRSLAVRLGPYVNVNAISPGTIETEMTASITPDAKKLMAEEAPLKRLGKPEEVARAALFLASDESDFITGEILTVSGGRAMR